MYFADAAYDTAIDRKHIDTSGNWSNNTSQVSTVAFFTDEDEGFLHPGDLHFIVQLTTPAHRQHYESSVHQVISTQLLQMFMMLYSVCC